MAHEWYIQHGGKQHGPVSSAQLKKLAAERKITPATTVRLGTTGNWVPAARVQGLFTQAAASPTAPPAVAKPAPAKPPVAKPAPPPAPLLAADPLAMPPAPLVASPLARAPLGSVLPVGKKGAAEEISIAPKIVGAVGLILGILAFTTCWLPVLGSPLGWTGIGVGGLGLLLGIVGLVLAAMKKGVGLYVNVAAASTSLVGLVLTFALAVAFGMLWSAPQAVVMAPPVAAPPPPPAPEPVVPEPEPEPEPEPPPEPVWVDASESIDQAPIRATIAGIAIEKVRLDNAMSAQITRGHTEQLLRIRVKIFNMSDNRIVEVPGWTGEAAGIAGQLGGLLEGSELGKTVSSATATATLVDNHGNNYAQTPESMLFGAQTKLGVDSAVRPGEGVEKQIIFKPPLENIEYLRLLLPAAGFSGSEPLRFQIPKSMITGL